MGLKHAIHTLVRRDTPPAAKSNNESFNKSIRNFVYGFVHRNYSTATDHEADHEEHDGDTKQDVPTPHVHVHDLRRFPGGYQIGEHYPGQISHLS
jgi:hypothetical protein